MVHEDEWLEDVNTSDDIEEPPEEQLDNDGLTDYEQGVLEGYNAEPPDDEDEKSLEDFDKDKD